MTLFRPVEGASGLRLIREAGVLDPTGFAEAAALTRTGEDAANGAVQGAAFFAGVAAFFAFVVVAASLFVNPFRLFGG